MLVTNLIREKLENDLVEAKKSSHYSEKDKCALMEGLVDSVHAIGVVINGSHYESTPATLTLEGLQTDLWDVMEEKYGVITAHQIFGEDMESENLHFEDRFEGTFTNGDGERDHSRVDYTQHCICALMKVESMLFQDSLGVNGYYSYQTIITDDASMEFVETGFPRRYGYDLLVIFSVITLLAVVATFIFSYWCCVHPKQQRKRFDYLGGDQLEKVLNNAESSYEQPEPSYEPNEDSKEPEPSEFSVNDERDVPSAYEDP